MKLTILYIDGRVEEMQVRRVANLQQTDGEKLYCETFSNLRGKGTRIPMSSIKCWEVEAPISGGSHGLKL